MKIQNILKDNMMQGYKKRWLYFMFIVLLSVVRVTAGITYDKKNNRITVADFPEEKPATLDDVLDADRMGGWKRVTYDKTNDTYKINASLWIGSNQDWGTFFQIGRPDHPRETLVLHGDLVVTPPKNTGCLVKHYSNYDGSRRDHRYRVSNRLTMGDRKNPDIKATVKIDCSRKNEFGVIVKAEPRKKSSKGTWYYSPLGEWYMFNSVLTAATPDKEHTYKGGITLSHAGVNYRMNNSTFSWWSGKLFRTAYIAVRGLKEEDKTIRKMTFENGGSAAAPFKCVDCVFRNLTCARIDNGALRCVFEGNQTNIILTPSQVGVVLTDCQLGQTKKPVYIPRTKRDEQWLRNYSVYNNANDLKLVLNPGFIEYISLPVEVKDDNGKPVSGAAVMVDCPNDNNSIAIIRNLAVTNADGITSSKAEQKAIVITKRELRPTDDPLKPEKIHYTYRLRVKAPGYEVVEKDFSTNEKIPNPMQVILKKE